MRSFLVAVLMCCVLLIAATSRSDVSSNQPTPTTATEPITGTAAVAAPGSAAPARDPFAPYGVGEGTWSYDDLNEAEKPTADRNRDVSGWDQTHAAFASAVAERSHQAAAEAAEHQLGLDDLAIGVVP